MTRGRGRRLELVDDGVHVVELAASHTLRGERRRLRKQEPADLEHLVHVAGLDEFQREDDAGHQLVGFQ